MPRFRIVIEGSDVQLPGDIADAPSEVVRGFFVARVVNAPSVDVAAARATEVVAREWSDGRFGYLQARPRLRVAEVRPAGLWEWLRAKNTGYVFHPGH